MLPIRRPGRVVHGADLFEADALGLFSALGVDDDELVVAVRGDDEREVPPVRGPGPRGVDVAERLDVRIRVRAQQLTNDLPGVRVGQEEVRGEEVLLRDRRHVAPVRADGRRHVHGSPPVGRAEQEGSRLGRRGLALHEGEIVLGDLLLPAHGQRVRGHAQDLADRRLEADAQGAAVDLDDRVVPVRPSDVGPQRLPEAVGEVLRLSGHLLDRGQLVAPDGVPDPHRGEGVVTTHRQVLGHALDQPEGQRVQPLEPAAPPRLGDVVLEGVHQLVAQHVVGVPVRSGQGHDHPVLQGLGNAARTLADRRPTGCWSAGSRGGRRRG